jgi:hypothetical protein
VIVGAAERRNGTDRRVSHVSLRYPERRSGFDRRAPQGGKTRLAWTRMLDSYRRRPAVIAFVLAAIIVANAADFTATLVALRIGAREVNPVMAHLLRIDPVLAGAFKLLVAAGVAGAMWVLRRHRRVLEASLLVLAAMAGLLVYHALGLTASL